MSESNYAQKLIQADEMAKKEGLNVPLNVIPSKDRATGRQCSKPKSQLEDTALCRPTFPLKHWTLSVHF